MYTAEYFVENLNMTAHPEGGFYKETFASTENISDKDLDVNFTKLIIYTNGMNVGYKFR